MAVRFGSFVWLGLAVLTAPLTAAAGDEPRLSPVLIPRADPLPQSPPLSPPPGPPPPLIPPPTPPPSPRLSPPPSEPPSLPSAPPVPAKQWRTSLSAGGDLLFDGQRIAGVGGVDADVYLKPVVDDPAVPLGALAFLQRPNTISASVHKTFSGFGGGFGAMVIPFEQTGLVAFVRGDYEPQSQIKGGGGGLLLVHYFFPNVRGAVGYVGSRAWGTTDYYSSDGFRGHVTALLGPVVVDGQLEVLKSSPQAFYFAPRVALTYLLGRHWGIGVRGGASWTTISGLTISSQWFGASLAVYLTDSVSVSVSWSSLLRQTPPGLVFLPGAPFVAVAPLFHDLGLGVGVRL